MNEERNRVEETMGMGDHVQRVAPSSDLMNRLRNIPSQVKQGYDMVPKKVIWLTAASIALLIGLNFFSLNDFNQTDSNNTTTETEQDSYFSYLKNV